MSKVSNAVYGLALGDGLGFVTERMRFPEISSKFAGKPMATDSELTVSDDTQMSMALIESLMKYYEKHNGIDTADTRIPYVAREFVHLYQSKKLVGAGKATLSSLEVLSKTDLSDPYIGADTSSVGSGTVMRSPWVGLGNIVRRDLIEEFSNKQARITHGSELAQHTAFLTALITKALFQDHMIPGEIKKFALDYCDYAKKFSPVWEFLADQINMIDDLPFGWESMALESIDLSEHLGRFGRCDTVLVTAIAISDAFGECDPLHALHRGMFTGGDSDTINAVVGAFVGAHHEDNIWGRLPEECLGELTYQRMGKIIDFIETC